MIITIADDLSAHVVSEDELSECRLPSYNPETFEPWENEDAVRAYIARALVENPFHWSPVKTPEQIAAETAARVQAEIAAEAQRRLDAFAKTRGYEGILAACTYATSAVPQWQAEGQACVNLRDAMWAALYEIMADVQSGARPLPAGIADLEAELPTLEWPA